MGSARRRSRPHGVDWCGRNRDGICVGIEMEIRMGFAFRIYVGMGSDGIFALRRSMLGGDLRSEEIAAQRGSTLRGDRHGGDQRSAGPGCSRMRLRDVDVAEFDLHVFELGCREDLISERIARREDR